MATRISQTGNSLDWIFQPLNNAIVNPLTDLLTNRIVLPTLKKMYSFLGNSTVQIVRKVSPQAADTLAENLKDPLSTETLLSLGQTTQEWSLQWGRRQPNSYPGTGYVDICTIIAARHMYIFASDMRVILTAPKQLRTETEAIILAAREEIVNPSERKNQREKRLSSGISRVNTPTLTSMAVQDTAKSKLNRLEQETYRLLNEQEKTTRQKVVEKGIEFLCSGVISSSIRTTAKVAIAIGCYKVLGETAIVLTPFLNEELMEMARSITKTASAGITSAGAFLFFRCSDTINNFFTAAQIFDVKASPLRELAPTVGQQSIDQIIKNVQTELGPFSEAFCLSQFAERIKGHPIELEFEDGSRLFFQRQNPGGMV